MPVFPSAFPETQAAQPAELMRLVSCADLVHTMLSWHSDPAPLLSWQVPDLDAIVVPVSGGGMLSGCTLAFKEVSKHAGQPCLKAASSAAYCSPTTICSRAIKIHIPCAGKVTSCIASWA